MASEMVTLRTLAPYRSATEQWAEGVQFDTTPEHAAWLQRDAPGVFEIVAPQASARPKPRRTPKRTTTVEPDEVTTK